MASDPRHVRLINDEEALRNLERDVNWERKRLEITPQGSRPYAQYQLVYYCAGYTSETGSVERKHVVELKLPPGYPQEDAPEFRFLTPIVHPHIYANPPGLVCLGEFKLHWKPTVQLEHLILHVSRFIRLDPEYLELRDAADGRGAAFWNEFFRRHRTPADDEPFAPREPRVRVAPRGTPTILRPAVSPEARVRMPLIRTSTGSATNGPTPPTSTGRERPNDIDVPRRGIVIRRQG